MRSWPGLRPTAAIGLAALVSAETWAADSGPAAAQAEEIHVGFSRRTFLGVNETDAQAAYKAFAVTSARRRGYDLRVVSTVYDDLIKMRQTIEQGELDLFIVDSWSFLKFDFAAVATPQFVSTQPDGLGKPEVLLVRRDSPYQALADLRGTRALEYESANSMLGRHWLETLLLETKLGRPEDFFETLTSVPKPSAAVLPVFFGKREACIVDQASFTVLQELNPQLGRELRILATSPPLMHAVTGVKKSGWSSPRLKDDLIETLLDLHNDPAGRQILLVFKTPRVIRFEEKHLAGVRALFERYQRLTTANPAATASESSHSGAAAPGPSEMQP